MCRYAETGSKGGDGVSSPGEELDAGVSSNFVWDARLARRKQGSRNIRVYSRPDHNHQTASRECTFRPGVQDQVDVP